MTDDILTQLKEFKGKIDNYKAIRNQVDAEVKFTIQKVKEEFDCNSLEEAQGLLVQMISEAEADKSKLTTDYATLVEDAKQKGLI